MLRSSWRRLFAWCLALPAVLAAPVVPLAHGVEHRALLHHEVAGLESAHMQQVAVSAEDDDHHARHGHPQLGATVATRDGWTFAAVHAPRIEISIRTPAKQHDAPGYRVRLTAHRSHAPPPALRSPPTIPG